MNALNRRKIIPIQAAGSEGGFHRGGVDTIRAKRARGAASFAELAGSFQHVHFYLRRPAAPWLQPVCQPGEHMALGRSRAGLAPKNAPRLPISAEQFRVTAENVEQ